MDYRGQKETELDQFINFYSSTSYSDESKARTSRDGEQRQELGDLEVMVDSPY